MQQLVSPAATALLRVLHAAEQIPSHLNLYSKEAFSSEGTFTVQEFYFLR